MGRNLDEARRLGEIDGRITNLGQEDAVEHRVGLKLLKDLHAVVLRRLAIDEGLLQAFGIALERVKVVGEDDDLVSALLVRANKVLTRLELGRVHHKQQLALARVRRQVLSIKLGCHRAPHFGTLRKKIFFLIITDFEIVDKPARWR